MLTKKSHLDVVRKFEALLMNEQKVHEVDEIEIVDSKVETGTIGKESKELSIPEEKKLTGSIVSFEGIKPQKFIKIKAKKITDNRTSTSTTDIAKFRYDPKTKTITKL